MVKIIIEKTISDRFYILIEGHAPNAKFQSVVKGLLKTYKEAKDVAETVAATLGALGHEYKVTVNYRAVEDMQAYHEEYALTHFPLSV